MGARERNSSKRTVKLPHSFADSAGFAANAGSKDHMESRACAYAERPMAFIFCLRPAPWNPVFCRIAYAVAATADVFNARRALGIFAGGRVRHRRFRPLALGLCAAPATQVIPTA